MARRFLIFGLIVSLAAIGVAYAQQSNSSTSGEKSHENVGGNVFHGTALFVRVRGGPDASLALDHPEVRLLGDQAFVVGHALDQPVQSMRTWVPVLNLVQVEEFSDSKELAKMYRLNVSKP